MVIYTICICIVKNMHKNCAVLQFYISCHIKENCVEFFFFICSLVGDYMISVSWDEIPIRPAGTDFTLPSRVEIKFRLRKAGQFSTWHLLGFVCIFFEFFS